jgi:hypothetical protein
MFNYDKTYDRVINKVLGPNMIFPDFINLEGVIKRTEKIVNYLFDRSQRLDKECFYCDKSAMEEFTREVYETPWDDEPVEKFFCSEECEQYYLYSGDFRYFICDCCEREICEQNPRNGWHVQYRMYNDAVLCLKCFEEEMLTNGLSYNNIKDGDFTGMFFDYKDLEDAGFEEGKVFFINSASTEKLCRKYCLKLKETGHLVLVNFERLAIGGIEGTVSVWFKKDSLQ